MESHSMVKAAGVVKPSQRHVSTPRTKAAEPTKVSSSSPKRSALEKKLDKGRRLDNIRRGLLKQGLNTTSTNKMSVTTQAA
ncbi:hypothetical protein PT974_10045 [Cladobotryum mycophilum]|uniref:Uncharacterized protein n=1 Tax=Cladobotryum mycophilum TaxID=491253 RepID=A0ABR0S9P5_9HYPO